MLSCLLCPCPLGRKLRGSREVAEFDAECRMPRLVLGIRGNGWESE